MLLIIKKIFKKLETDLSPVIFAVIFEYYNKLGVSEKELVEGLEKIVSWLLNIKIENNDNIIT